jgi:hypothetical protein
MHLIFEEIWYISYPCHLDTHLKSLHRRTDFSVVNLLIEHITEAVAAVSILSRDDKAVELWLQGVLLGAEPKAMRQAQLHTDFRHKARTSM